MVFIGETAAGPAQVGYLYFFQRFYNIQADTSFVGDAAILSYPESVVNTTTQVFGEMAVDMPADGYPGVTGIDIELCR
jgi:hypothetical protein